MYILFDEHLIEFKIHTEIHIYSLNRNQCIIYWFAVLYL